MRLSSTGLAAEVVQFRCITLKRCLGESAGACRITSLSGEVEGRLAIEKRIARRKMQMGACRCKFPSHQSKVVNIEEQQEFVVFSVREIFFVSPTMDSCDLHKIPPHVNKVESRI